MTGGKADSVLSSIVRTLALQRAVSNIKEFRISDPIQIALILLDLQLNIEILQVTHVMD